MKTVRQFTYLCDRVVGLEGMRLPTLPKQDVGVNFREYVWAVTVAVWKEAFL